MIRHVSVVLSFLKVIDCFDEIILSINEMIELLINFIILILEVNACRIQCLLTLLE